MSESSKDTQQVSVSLLNTMHTHRQRKIISSMGAREIVWVLYNQVNIFFTEFNTTLCCTEENSKLQQKCCTSSQNIHKLTLNNCKRLSNISNIYSISNIFVTKQQHDTVLFTLGHSGSKISGSMYAISLIPRHMRESCKLASYHVYIQSGNETNVQSVTII